jgi:hypothetical protein
MLREDAFVVIGAHGAFPVGLAAPIAAFTATASGRRTGLAPQSTSEAAGAQRRMAETGYFVSRCKARRFDDVQL